MDKTSAPKIYGILGYPAKHSLSPLMHNAAFRALKIDAEYKIFEVKPEGLEDFLSINNLKKENIWGLNVTIPHKIKAKEILEKNFPFDYTQVKQLETEYYVKLSGAINTIKREDDRLYYYNTDTTGFLRSLEMDLNFKTKNKKVLLIGCGGAGRAVIASLSWENADVNKIYINDINDEAMKSAENHFLQFEHLKDKLKFISKEDIPLYIKECQLLVNATPIGMKGEDIPIIDKKLLHDDLYVYDLVYNRDKKTRLVKDAESRGLKEVKVVDGLSMLLYQGADAFELWIGQKAPVEIMREALNIRS